jgi:mRNA interferase MazF
VPHPATPPKRGEIYWVDFNPVIGSEQRGRRPAVVISADDLNSRLPVVAVAAVTTTLTKLAPSAARIVVDLPSGRPLAESGRILAFQVRTIDKQRLRGYLGILTASQRDELSAALRAAWDLGEAAAVPAQDRDVPRRVARPVVPAQE